MTVLHLVSLCFVLLLSKAGAEVAPVPDVRCGAGTVLHVASMECRVSGANSERTQGLIWSNGGILDSWRVLWVGQFLAAAVLACTLFLGWIKDSEYVLECEVDAPIDALYSLLTDVNRIAEVHPQLRGVSTVLREQHEKNGAVVEWELETSAMWAPPRCLGFLKKLKTKEHVYTVATLTPGKHAHIQNVGLKGYRGKLVPFYYVHYWDLTSLGPKKTKITEYELLKGSAVKFLLGSTEATLEAHKQIQANIRQWALDNWGEKHVGADKTRTLV